jgi:beta-galactosidase
MRGGIAAIWLVVSLLVAPPSPAPPPLVPSYGGIKPALVVTDRRVSLDKDWRFQRGDAAGAEQPSFDDSRWRRLNVPHDWAIEGPFDEKYGPSQGALPAFGVAWYRKHFDLSRLSRRSADLSRRSSEGAKAEGAQAEHVSVQFDGAMSHARVWLNGHELGERPYGYISFSFDLTPYLRPAGEDNVLAVRLAPEEQSSRWYPGAGIYRHVWLDVTGPVRVAHWGTYVTTPDVTAARATIDVRTTIENAGASDANVDIETRVLDEAGREVARTVSEPRSIRAHGRDTVEARVTVARPHLWDIDHPTLHRVVTIVHNRAETPAAVLDRYETPFGIRSISFDAKNGFRLNGRRVQIRGVCMHHDLGALGAAVDRSAIERQLRTLKEMGANAIRTSHNPPAPELLDVADRLGLVVMDEAFDEWRMGKVKNGLHTFFDKWGETDLRDMIHRDRNHPSVVMWSIGNEVIEQGDPSGATIAHRLTQICHEEDPTRPVTSAMNNYDNAIKNGMAQELDIKGLNYGAVSYDRIVREHPDWIVLGAETASTVSSRGWYHLPLKDYEKDPSHQVSSYDVVTPMWASLPDVEFDAEARTPSVIGEFVWTGFDYLGEPTPYFEWRNTDRVKDWPSRSSYFGIVDLAGFPKDRYYLYQSHWTTTPVVHIVPENWGTNDPRTSNLEPRTIPVMVYTNAQEVELFLNGKSLGRKKLGVDTVRLPVNKKTSPSQTFTSRYRLMWDVPVQPGTLRADAYTNGKRAASTEVRTPGPPAKIVLKADRTAIGADDDLSFITVRIEDRDGNFCGTADNDVRFTISGPATIAGVDNGDASSLESFQADHHKAFDGLALLIVRAGAAAGAVKVSASAQGLAPATLVLKNSGGK